MQDNNFFRPLCSALLFEACFALVLAGCRQKETPAINYLRDFDSLSRQAYISASNQSSSGDSLWKKTFDDLIVTRYFDSIGQPIRVYYPYLIKNYHDDGSDLHFSFIKDRQDVFHFFPMTMWNQLAHNTAALYHREERNGATTLILKDSIDVLPIDSREAAKVLHEELDALKKMSIGDYHYRVRNLLGILERLYHPFMGDEVTFSEIEAYATSHSRIKANALLALSELKAMDVDARNSLRTYKVSNVGFVVLKVDPDEKDQIGILFIPFESRGVMLTQ